MKDRREYRCEHCNELLVADIIRFDDGKLYHLDCFEQFMHPELKKGEVFSCPKCKTTGKYWSTSKNGWKKCKLCDGSGYIGNDV